ncbi:Arm DNA-binding domain-containing protein [Pseudomonas citronellolis]|uniref:Arm DNA-binding domain-containing protein n=1 Tax=Pseudomonas citronellolis TaxID=53408 RepID=UPI002FD93DDB
MSTLSHTSPTFSRGISGANPVRSISCPHGDAPTPHQITPFTHSSIKAAKPKGSQAAKVVLEIMPNGSKLWRLKYPHADKEKRLALGAYPTVPLQKVRQRSEDARRLLADGIPSDQKIDLPIPMLFQHRGIHGHQHNHNLALV